MMTALFLFAGMIATGLATWVVWSRLWLPSYSPKKIKALTESLSESLYEAWYQVGYDDQKAGCPEKVLESADSDNLSGIQRATFLAIVAIYQRGRQDALEGKPSVAEKIRENRNEQIRILNEMVVILKGVTTSKTPAS